MHIHTYIIGDGGLERGWLFGQGVGGKRNLGLDVSYPWGTGWIYGLHAWPDRCLADLEPIRHILYHFFSLHTYSVPIVNVVNNATPYVSFASL